MQESCTYGSMRGAPSNGRPYRNRQEKWSMPSSSGDQTRGGRTLTLRGGAESSLDGRDTELSVSPKDIPTSPYDLCANLGRGTDGSNLLSSSGAASPLRT
jgi:hypothetical protein